MKHSGLGIASFALSIIVGIAVLAVFVAAGIAETSTPGGMDEESPVAIIIGLGIFAAGGLGLVALGLGVASFFQSERKKLFGILGVVFSGAILLVTAGLMLLGLMLG